MSDPFYKGQIKDKPLKTHKNQKNKFPQIQSTKGLAGTAALVEIRGFENPPLLFLTFGKLQQTA